MSVNVTLSAPQVVTQRAAEAGMDTQTLNLVETVVNCVLVTSVATFGIVGNVFNLIVLSHHSLQESTNVALLSLSAADLLYVAGMFLRGVNCIVSKFDVTLSCTLEAGHSMYAGVFVRLMSIVSSGHILLISVERVVAVYLPLHVSLLFTSKRMLAYVVCLYIFWLCPSFPSFFYHKLEWTTDAENVTCATTGVSKFAEEHFRAMFLIEAVSSIIRGPASVFVLIVTSAMIGARLFKISKSRTAMGVNLKANFDVRIVKMLLIVCLVYLVAGIPTMLQTMIYQISPQLIMSDYIGTPLFDMLEYVIDFLYVVNSSVNFIIYCAMSTKFRSTYFQLMRGCLPSRFHVP